MRLHEEVNQRLAAAFEPGLKPGPMSVSAPDVMVMKTVSIQTLCGCGIVWRQETGICHN